MKKVLITGFEAFGNDAVNPTLEAIKLLQGQSLNGGMIVTCKVPVVRYKSIATVIAAIEAEQPDVVITLGQATGRSAITPERVAINIDDFRIADNEGQQVIDQSVVENGPAAYFSSLPIKAIVNQIRLAGIPAQVSNSAGTFVCNHLFYGVQHYLQGRAIKHGFIHVPSLPSQATSGNEPTMALSLIVQALVIAAQTAIDTDDDILQGAGYIC